MVKNQQLLKFFMMQLEIVETKKQDAEKSSLEFGKML
jgi:hypothetical protein